MDSQATLATLNDGTLFAERYQIVKQIGHGGMGEVYLAKDTLLDNEQIALKVLFAHLSKDAKHSKRFLREVQLTRKLGHKNVVRTYDVGQCQGRLYLSMEYIEGMTLRERLTQGLMNHLECAHIIKEIALGLSAVHEIGVIHRDLKPANVLIDSYGAIKITDFGVAREATSELTATNEIVGSIAYLAPELWIGKDIGPSADLYALGVLSYECLSGILPFDGSVPAEVMCKHLEVHPLALTDLVPEIPMWLNDIVMRLLRKDPQQRFSSAVEIADAIELGLRQNDVDTEASTQDQGWQLDLCPSPEEVTLTQGAEAGDMFSIPVSLSPQDTYIGNEPSTLDVQVEEGKKPKELKVWALQTTKALGISVSLALLLYFPINAISVILIRQVRAALPLVVFIPVLGQHFAAALFFLAPVLFLSCLKYETPRAFRIWLWSAAASVFICIFCSNLEIDNLARNTVSYRSGLIHGTVPLAKDLYRNCRLELYWMCKYSGICK